MKTYIAVHTIRLYKAVIFMLLLLSGLAASATHNRAGEITYRHLSGLTYEVSVLTYTFTPSLADRPSLDIEWGDGSMATIPRTQKTNLPNDVTRNIYVGTHTYSGPGTFKISVYDPNRNSGILNIPGSVNVPFYIESILRISQFLNPNSSPVLLNPPLDHGCVNKPFWHNPAAYDPDGDSLVYSLIPCKGEYGQAIPGFTMPQASVSFTIDPHSGTLSWISPMTGGEYNIAILIQEYRNGQLLGSVTRDMQIIVQACNNDPPVITTLTDTCVEAGSLLSFQVVSTDPNNNQITLSATGGPMVVQPDAAFFPTLAGFPPLSGTFQWQTSCTHVKKLPWTVLFKAIDNSTPINLASFKTVEIQVISPAPKNLTAQPSGNSILLRWDQAICKNAIGYKVYRRVGSNGFVPGVCETGMPPSAGYQLISRINSISDTVFVDNNQGAGLTQGLDYCYRLVAFFPDSAESYVSSEVCTSLIKNVAVITHVSIRHTSPTQGSLDLIWSKPTQLDTIQHPGPYKYLIYGGYSPTTMSLTDSLFSLNDTLYFDTLLNTLSSARYYHVDLWNNAAGNTYLIGQSSRASSIFLQSSPTDEKLILNWNEQVPWSNTHYVIYRLNPLSNAYDSIGSSTVQTFTDTGLINGNTYCYKVEGYGTYFAQGYTEPFRNYSQQHCNSPTDNIAPCPPVLKVDYDCDNFLNRLQWTNPNNHCADDVLKYEIYYSPRLNGDFSLIAQITSANDITFIHQGMPSIAGCYVVTALDSMNNKSPFSNRVCIDIDNCQLYRLPNVFTPNGDNYNDKFQPFMPYSFVERVEMKIFNRWGQLVFTTSDPDINWDGKHKDNGNDCSEGAYFYVCDVFELRLSGSTRRTLKGSVTLYR